MTDKLSRTSTTTSTSSVKIRDIEGESQIKDGMHIDPVIPKPTTTFDEPALGFEDPSFGKKAGKKKK